MKVGDALGVSRDPVPAGVYALEVVDSDQLENPAIRDSSQGRQISILCNVIKNDQYEGRGVWLNFNIVKAGIFYFASFLQESGFCGEDQEMGDPFSEDEYFMDFLDSMRGHRFMAELTLEQVYSKKHQKEVDVNKVISQWPYEETNEAKVPDKAKEILGKKQEAPPAKAVGPAKTSAPPKRSAPPKKELPPWAKGADEGGEEVAGEDIPL